MLGGAAKLNAASFKAKINVDGTRWYKGAASCILVGNVGSLFGGIEAFDDARPDDGMLELGVVTAQSALEWTRMIARTALGTTAKSPFVQMTRAKTIEVEMNRKVLYELDGGDREKVKSFEIEVEPAAIDVCVPVAAEASEKPPAPTPTRAARGAIAMRASQLSLKRNPPAHRPPKKSRKPS